MDVDRKETTIRYDNMSREREGERKNSTAQYNQRLTHLSQIPYGLICRALYLGRSYDGSGNAFPNSRFETDPGCSVTIYKYSGRESGTFKAILNI